MALGIKLSTFTASAHEVGLVRCLGMDQNSCGSALSARRRFAVFEASNFTSRAMAEASLSCRGTTTSASTWRHTPPSTTPSPWSPSRQVAACRATTEYKSASHASLMRYTVCATNDATRSISSCTGPPPHSYSVSVVSSGLPSSALKLAPSRDSGKPSSSNFLSCPSDPTTRVPLKTPSRAWSWVSGSCRPSLPPRQEPPRDSVDPRDEDGDCGGREGRKRVEVTQPTTMHRDAACTPCSKSRTVRTLERKVPSLATASSNTTTTVPSPSVPTSAAELKAFWSLCLISTPSLTLALRTTTM
mmetsp:Transcript_79617/g.158975  ORF Transcript_79617/g.158975 Transcript_79617/m.158975 type:complete len:301 (-) Transcript_79617:986-1888(-)